MDLVSYQRLFPFDSELDVEVRSFCERLQLPSYLLFWLFEENLVSLAFYLIFLLFEVNLAFYLRFWLFVGKFYLQV